MATKKATVKYLVLERVKNRVDWQVGFCGDMFLTAAAAMEAIDEMVEEDPASWDDYEFKLAGINDQVITVKNTTTHELVVSKGE